MADTTTTNLGLTKPEPGAAEDTWGISLNNDLDAIDAIFSGTGTAVSLNIDGGDIASAVTINKSPVITLGGDLSGNVTLTNLGNGTLTATVGTLNQSTTGNAATATALATGRNFSLTGNVTASAVSFDGTGNVALATTLADSTVTSAKLSGNLVTPGTLDLNGQELILDADADTSITADTDDQIDFKTGGTDRLTITSGGDVAINSTTADPLSLAFTGTGLALNEDSGTAFMQIDGGNGSRIDFGIGGSRNTTLYADNSVTELGRTSNHPIAFKTNNTERVRIANDGNVGIGTSSPATLLHVESGAAASTIIRVKGTVADGYRSGLEVINGHTGGLTYSLFSTNNSDGIFGGGKFVIGNEATNSVNASTAGLLVMDSAGNVGLGTTSPANDSGYSTLSLSNTTGGQVVFKDDGTTMAGILGNATNLGLTTVGNRFINFTTNSSERMRIDGSGNFLVGKTSASQSTAGFEITGANMHNVTSTNTSSGSSTFMVSDGSNLNFYVNFTGQVFYKVALTNLSDQRLKENIVNLDKGLDDILKIKPRRFDWIEGEGEKNQTGFIAQEIEEAGLEELVSHYKGASLDDAKGVNQVGLIPILVKAIQEQQTIIEDLQTQINEVKNGN